MGRTPPVVITRKRKRLNWGLHLLMFALTGGTSAPITAAKAATNASYNARTRKLAEDAEGKRQFTDADHERALRAGREAMKKMSAKRQAP